MRRQTQEGGGAKKHRALLVLGPSRSEAQSLLADKGAGEVNHGQVGFLRLLGLGLRPNVFGTRVFQVRVQIAWGYVSTGSFKRINTPIINFQIYSSLKSMCWRCSGGRGGPIQLALLTHPLTRYKQDNSFTTTPPSGLPISRLQAKR